MREEGKTKKFAFLLLPYGNPKEKTRKVETGKRRTNLSPSSIWSSFRCLSIWKRLESVALGLVAYFAWVCLALCVGKKCGGAALVVRRKECDYGYFQ